MRFAFDGRNAIVAIWAVSAAILTVNSQFGQCQVKTDRQPANFASAKRWLAASCTLRRCALKAELARYCPRGQGRPKVKLLLARWHFRSSSLLTTSARRALRSTSRTLCMQDARCCAALLVLLLHPLRTLPALAPGSNPQSADSRSQPANLARHYQHRSSASIQPASFFSNWRAIRQQLEERASTRQNVL